MSFGAAAPQGQWRALNIFVTRNFFFVWSKNQTEYYIILHMLVPCQQSNAVKKRRDNWQKSFLLQSDLSNEGHVQLALQANLVKTDIDVRIKSVSVIVYVLSYHTKSDCNIRGQGFLNCHIPISLRRSSPAVSQFPHILRFQKCYP